MITTKQMANIFILVYKNNHYSPTRSFGVASLLVESDREKFRFKLGDWKESLGVVEIVMLEL